MLRIRTLNSTSSRYLHIKAKGMDDFHFRHQFTMASTKLIVFLSVTLTVRSWTIQNEVSRRSFWAKTAGSAVAGLMCPWLEPAHAIVRDETNTFANNWWDTPRPPSESPKQQQQSQGTMYAPTDEAIVTVDMDRGPLGLELADVKFRDNQRVYVKSVEPLSQAEQLGIQKDWVLVKINDRSTERTDAAGVKLILRQQNDRQIALTFRDPQAFRRQLEGGGMTTGQSVTTQVAPAPLAADGARDQRITVSQISPPPRICQAGAQVDDLLEISYRGTVVETGQVFDGSAVTIDGQGVAGRGNDVTLYFVLGKQPVGQFPPGWDVGMVGQCIGERRRLIVPPVLGYGSAGVPRRNIPPNATLQYDITLVSINGLAF